MEDIRVLIADHESPSRKRLAELIGGREGYEVVGTCGSGQEALALVRQHRPELIVLEAQLPDVSGTEVLKALDPSHDLTCVFVSLSGAHAIQAFELRAVDYVVKPFADARLLTAIDRAHANIMLARLNLHPDRLKRLMDGNDGEALVSVKTPSEVVSPYLKRLAVHTGRTISVIRVNELDYIEGAGVYANLHVGNKTYLLRETLGRLEGRLDPSQFMRIHRSTIVNVDRVQELKPQSHGEYLVHLTTGAKLKLSRSRRGTVERILGRL